MFHFAEGPTAGFGTVNMTNRPSAEPSPIIGIDRLVDAGLIRLLLTIANTGRFAAAADQLGITQPSVSQQVKRIETLVGRPLFHRARRGVRLTADGEAVIVYAGAMLGLTEDLKHRLSSLEKGSEVIVGMSEDFCRTGLATVLRLFVLDHAHVRVKVFSGTYQTLALAIENRTVDFVVMRRYHRFPEAEFLFRDEMAWYGGAGLRLPIVDPVPLVLPLPPSPARETVIECLRAAGRKSVIRFESIGMAGMEMAISSNLGVCAGPQSMVLLDIKPLPYGHNLPSLPQVDFVIVRAGASFSDLGRAFANVMIEAARQRFKLAGDMPDGGGYLLQPR